jgi:hypothetical protein
MKRQLFKEYQFSLSVEDLRNTWQSQEMLLFRYWYFTAPRVGFIQTAIIVNPLCRELQNTWQSQWPRGLRRRSSAARLLRLWVRIPPGAWMSVVSVVCFQVEVSATDWSLVQRSPNDCGASLCMIKKPRKTRRLKPATGLWKYKHNGL